MPPTPENAELLRRYADEKSEAAFAELVRRHLDLVYSVALRQCGGDAHLAQDVVQQVFTDLARKAPALARQTVLAHKGDVTAESELGRGTTIRFIFPVPA